MHAMRGHHSNIAIQQIGHDHGGRLEIRDTIHADVTPKGVDTDLAIVFTSTRLVPAAVVAITVSTIG